MRMQSYLLVALLLLKQVFAASEAHGEVTFDGFKDIREGLAGSMTREFREQKTPDSDRLHHSNPRIHDRRPRSLGLDFLINNETLDEIFAGLRLRFAESGPVTINLPADQDSFTVELFNNTMDGQVSVYGGKIQGLESIHRTGDTTLDVNALRRTATFTTSIGLNDLSASYYGSLLLKGLGTDAGLDLSISHIELHVKLYAKIQLLQMKLEKLEIQELSFPQVGSFESHIKLTGILDPVIDMLLDTVLNLIVGEPIFESLADILQQIINDMLADMNVSSMSPYLNAPNYLN